MNGGNGSRCAQGIESDMHATRRVQALRLFEQRQVTLVQAAKLAAMTAEEFLILLGEAGVPAVDYPPEELDDEIRVAS